jgi:hypothetical protein
MDTIYDRQESLDLNKFDKVLVIGAGGIGSWVVMNLALSGCIKEIHVCDSDVIEASNLNRTPFARHHIGMSKVWAIRDLVSERRHDVVVVPMNEIVQSLDIDICSYDVIIDCSDGLMVKEWMLSQKFVSYMKLGYDGWSVTIDVSKVMPWDEGDTGYHVVPSFVVPPQFLACVAVGSLLSGSLVEGLKTFDVRDVMDRM